jgi:hypothetical protein
MTGVELEKQLVIFAKPSDDRGLAGGTGGNFRARLADGRIALSVWDKISDGRIISVT